MADTYGPFAAATWSDGEWAKYAPTWAPSGPVGTAPASAGTGDFAFTTTGLTVTIGTGKAWVRGFGLSRTTSVNHSATANSHATFSRRDRIVLKRDLGAGTVTTVFKAGTAASTPTAPSLTQSDTGVWEEALFSFLTPPNSGTNITGVIDERKWVDPGGSGRNAILRAQRIAAAPLATSGTWTAFTNDTSWTERDTYDIRGSGALITPGAGLGEYDISVILTFNNNAAGRRGIRLNPSSGMDIGAGASNPVTLVEIDATSGGIDTTINGSLPVNFTSTSQSVQVEGIQSSGGSLDVNRILLRAVYLGPTT